ncbi:MAG TPA: hypothetical protein VN683_04810 [Acidothermaceae bacterium]|nr:hypothetical protein [Acidothermaceae bacterium]
MSVSGNAGARLPACPSVLWVAAGTSDGAAQILQVSEDSCADAVRLLLSTTHNLAEPAGAIALAGLLSERSAARGRRVAVIQSGGNIDTPLLVQILAGETPAV